MSDHLSWFVIQTKPASEERAERNLLNQGIETFLPRYEALRYSGGKMVSSVKPLFPSYLFVRLDLGLHYYKVKWTRGVNRILGNGEGPLPVSDRVIVAIQARMGRDNLVQLDDGLQEGDPVRIRSGPFKDFYGIFQRKLSDRGRVRILLNLVGVDVPVQTYRWQIQRVL